MGFNVEVCGGVGEWSWGLGLSWGLGCGAVHWGGVGAWGAKKLCVVECVGVEYGKGKGGTVKGA